MPRIVGFAGGAVINLEQVAAAPEEPEEPEEPAPESSVTDGGEGPMATSAILVCNRALHKLGARTINSLDDNKESARVMRIAYDPVRRAELRRHRWRFSIARVSLPALTEEPDSDYARQFQLPNDFLRLIEGGDIVSVADLSDYRGGVSALYSVEGGKILTDLAAPLAIRYLRDVTDTALFDAAFLEAFAARLAYEGCERITESNSKEDALLRGYRMAIKEAVIANALEVASEYPADSSWVVTRNQ